MNDKIKQLAEQVGAVRNVLAMGRHDGVLFTEFELEKFAELIVRECLSNMENCDGDLDFAIWKTKKDFGIEDANKI